MSFYEQLSLSTSPQPIGNSDGSKSVLMNASIANYTTMNMSRVSKGIDGGMGDVRRHIERLLLRLDFNGRFSKPQRKREDAEGEANILAQGGLA